MEIAWNVGWKFMKLFFIFEWFDWAFLINWEVFAVYHDKIAGIFVTANWKGFVVLYHVCHGWCFQGHKDIDFFIDFFQKTSQFLSILNIWFFLKLINGIKISFLQTHSLSAKYLLSREFPSYVPKVYTKNIQSIS